MKGGLREKGPVEYSRGMALGLILASRLIIKQKHISVYCVSTLWGPSINGKPRTGSFGPSETPWKIALQHLSRHIWHDPAPGEEGDSSRAYYNAGGSALWSHGERGSGRQREWEAEGVRTGSCGPVF